MSRKKTSSSTHFRPGQKKAERYIQPSLMMALRQRPSYGYELIQQLAQFGFVKDQPPPGMIYRHLRDLEENGLVSSEWETGGSGPAKRVYHLTPEGEAVLGLWVRHMQEQAQKLLEFIEAYRSLVGH